MLQCHSRCSYQPILLLLLRPLHLASDTSRPDCLSPSSCKSHRCDVRVVASPLFVLYLAAQLTEVADWQHHAGWAHTALGGSHGGLVRMPAVCVSSPLVLRAGSGCQKAVVQRQGWEDRGPVAGSSPTSSLHWANAYTIKWVHYGNPLHSSSDSYVTAGARQDRKLAISSQSTRRALRLLGDLPSSCEEDFALD